MRCASVTAREGTEMTIECEKFYDLMQTYRHAPLGDQRQTIAAYNEVIRYITRYVEQAIVKSRLED
jgi:hypothetical protein